MPVSIPLDKMTFAEKYEMFQLLWEDLCKQDEGNVIPDWHGEALREREIAVEREGDPSYTVEEAKKVLWERMGWK